jgi:hypothetical protein
MIAQIRKAQYVQPALQPLSAHSSRHAGVADSDAASPKPLIIRLHISSGLQPSAPILVAIFAIMFDIMRDIITGIALVTIATAIPPAVAPSTVARI